MIIEHRHYIIATLVVALSWIGYDVPLRSQTYNGIDVSHHQGIIDWEQVAKDRDIQYVYIKATTGTTGTDTCYAYNNKNARKNGLLVGAYHYFTANGSAHAQFLHFIEVAPKENQNLIPMVDVEALLNKWTIQQVQDSLQVFMDLCKNYYGRFPMIYGTQRSYNTYCAPRFNNYHLMIGRYGDDAPIIKGKGTYSIWQYSESGCVRGIPKPVDLSRFNKQYTIDILKL